MGGSCGFVAGAYTDDGVQNHSRNIVEGVASERVLCFEEQWRP